MEGFQYVSGHCRKGFEAQRSQVKIVVRLRKFHIRCNISVFCGGGENSMNLDTNNRHVIVSGSAEKILKVRGQRSRSQLCEKHFSG